MFPWNSCHIEDVRQKPKGFMALINLRSIKACDKIIKSALLFGNLLKAVNLIGPKFSLIH